MPFQSISLPPVCARPNLSLAIITRLATMGDALMYRFPLRPISQQWTGGREDIARGGGSLFDNLKLVAKSP